MLERLEDYNFVDSILVEHFVPDQLDVSSMYLGMDTKRKVKDDYLLHKQTCGDIGSLFKAYEGPNVISRWKQDL
jgi:hypothetical protein